MRNFMAAWLLATSIADAVFFVVIRNGEHYDPPSDELRCAMMALATLSVMCFVGGVAALFEGEKS